MRRTASFLDLHINEEEENTLLSHLSFESMKHNKAVNYEGVIRNSDNPETTFIRQGASGNWKKTLTEEQIKEFKIWTEKWLEGTDCDLYR